MKSKPFNPVVTLLLLAILVVQVVATIHIGKNGGVAAMKELLASRRQSFSMASAAFQKKNAASGQGKCCGIAQEFVQGTCSGVETMTVTAIQITCTTSIKP